MAGLALLVADLLLSQVGRGDRMARQGRLTGWGSARGLCAGAVVPP